MKHYAKLIRQDEHVEEEVVLSIGNHNITCFVDYTPYVLETNKIYPVRLSFTFIHDYSIDETKIENYVLEQIGDSFAYNVRGILVYDTMIVDGIAFQDEMFIDDCLYLDKQFIQFKADRIGVEFLEE
ncbi:hypothetical protein [Leminorella grimontii]|uniref:hypothetical protein n=1 Tax=Leminorella grimontii TaxID=82981 RepID=UPI0020813951|nr:hypothetical protein [Leminorella grimontii]GKX58738.1 hypothetical protein SOASR031_10530 [Leminorella grimontii]